MAVRFPAGAEAVAGEPPPGAEATASAAPFLDNLDHLRALEHEAKLMVAHAAMRACAHEGEEGGETWREIRRHFPFDPAGADLAGVRRLLEETAQTNRRRESETERAGVPLNLPAFCRERGLNDFERTVVALLLMQYTAPQFIAICRTCGFAEGGSGNGMQIGTLLEIVCDDYRRQIERRGCFSVDATLMRDEVVVLDGHVGETTRILDVKVCLHERVVRHALGDRNLYGSALGFIRRERGGADLEQVVLPGPIKGEVVACVGRYLEGRADGSLAALDTSLGYGTGLALLFHGPSGTGKTMLARALAARFDRQVISLVLAQMHSRRWSLEQMLGALFREAELQGQIVLLDECDDLFQNNSPMSRALLVELEKARCVVILTTNKSVDLDPALERRIAMKVPFCIPDAGTRLRMWRALLPAGVDLAPDVDLEACARRYRFSGGLIKNCVPATCSSACSGTSTRSPVFSAW